jgi:hypothetical protein
MSEYRILFSLQFSFASKATKNIPTLKGSNKYATFLGGGVGHINYLYCLKINLNEGNSWLRKGVNSK